MKSEQLKSPFMKALKEIFEKKIVPGLFAILFVTVLLLLSVVLMRRHVYF